MRIFITGIDGYLGWSLAVHLSFMGYDVAGIDNFSRRKWVDEMGSDSAIPIESMENRVKYLFELTGKAIQFHNIDLMDFQHVFNAYSGFKPDAIVYLGEMPSAPYSMIDVQHAVWTQTNNIMGTLTTLYAMRDACPDAHLIKLGTMGEYGTPNIDIPEGFIEIEHRGRKDRLIFPKKAGSWYHQSKVHDSNNLEMACRIWGLRSTDIMQGVVYGTQIDAMKKDDRIRTRFDFDQCFGTAINRFCAQTVIGIPMTPFGGGHQRRGFLALRDSIQCMKIAIDNPPKQGEYRVFNQFENVYSIFEIAEIISSIGNELGIDAKVNHIENPRIELEDHYYNPDHEHLHNLGYQPTYNMDQELRIILNDLIKYKEYIDKYKDAISPDIRWDGIRRKSETL